MKNYLKSLSGYWPTAHALSKNKAAALMLFLVMLSVPIRKRLFGRKPKRLHITLGEESLTFFARDGVDISVLREMFTEREYDFKENTTLHPTHIADVGAHIGAAALFLHTLYPNAKITCYEPDPDNFVLLQKNLSSFKKITCVNAAVAAKSGTTTLYMHKGGSTRATLTQDADSLNNITVRSINFDDVIKNGVDYIKFDVEGAEYDFFAAASSSALSKVAYLIGEVHFNIFNKNKADFEALFPNFSFVWHNSIVVIHRT